MRVRARVRARVRVRAWRAPPWLSLPEETERRMSVLSVRAHRLSWCAAPAAAASSVGIASYLKPS